MHESLRLYDTALQLMAKESEALEKEDDDLLAGIFKERVHAMAEAWEKREGCDKTKLLEKLGGILKIQDELMQKAHLQRESLRLTLQNSKREGSRLAGYGKAVSNRDTAFTIVREG